MKKELIAEITKKLGSDDAPGLIAKLKALGVEDDAQFYERGISIPAVLVKNLESFQQELNTVSKFGRAFNVSLVKDRIQIDTCAMKSEPIAFTTMSLYYYV